MKIRGYRIEPGEVEARLASGAGVREAAVVARPDARGELQLVAYVVQPAAAGAEQDRRRELQAYLNQSLPQYMVPQHFVWLDSLPRTASGKIDRNALPAPLPAARTERYVAPQTAAEHKLAAIWAELLDLPRVGLDDNFFELGGHSLSAVRMVRRVEESFQREVGLALAFRFQTLRELAHALEDHSAAAQLPTVVCLNASGDGSPLFCLHPAGGHVLSYRQLAERCRAIRPVYGVQARSFYRNDFVDESLRDVIEHYAEEIVRTAAGRDIQLLGWSFGGVLALEVARACRQRGIRVGYVGVIDPIDLVAPELLASASNAPIPDAERHRAALERWVEGSVLAAKWRRLLQQSTPEIRNFMLRSFIERELEDKQLDLAQESTLFNAVNCELLMQSYSLSPLPAQAVHSFWATDSLKDIAWPACRDELAQKVELATCTLVDTDHEQIIFDASVLAEVLAALRD